MDPQSITVDLNFQSPGLNVTMEEIKVKYQPAQTTFVQFNLICLNLKYINTKVLLDNYDKQYKLASTGFHLGGQKYFYLRYLLSTFTSGTSKVLIPGEPQSTPPMTQNSNPFHYPYVQWER